MFILQRLPVYFIVLYFLSIFLNSNIFSQGISAIINKDTSGFISTLVTPEYCTVRLNKFSPIPIVKIKKPKIALVLSGGGARGISHIGVLKVLEKYNIPIDIIYGTSIGAIIGGLYAIGYKPDQLLQSLRNVDMEDLFSILEEVKRRDLYPEQKQNLTRNFLTLRFKGLEPVIPSAISTGQKITNLINSLVLQGLHNSYSKFDDFPIPFRSVTTDIVSGKSIIISEGNLSEALRASFNWPLLNPTVNLDSMRLVDGGILANIPAHFARDDGYDLIIAVDATSRLRDREQLNTPWEILDQLFSIMQEQFNKKELQYADIIIHPLLEGRSNTDFSGLDSLVHIGEKATEQKINELLTLINVKSKNKSLDDSFYVDKIFFRDDFLSNGYLENIKSDQENNWVSTSQINSVLEKIHNLNYYSEVNCKIYGNKNKAKLEYNTKINPIIKLVKFSGNYLVPNQRIDSIFRPLINKPFNYKSWNAKFDSILQIYRNQQYSLANIRYTKYDSLNGTIFFSINEGKIKRIVIEGNERTKDFVILREFPLDTGEIFNLNKAEEGLTNISSTNLFEQVTLDIKYENSEPVLKIKVQEKYPELIRLGLRVDNEKKAQISIDIRNENFLGSGNDLGLSIQGGFSNFQSIFDFKTNKVFQTPLTYKLKLKYQFEDLNIYQDRPTGKYSSWDRIKVGDFREIKYGGSFLFGSQLEKIGYLYGEYKYEHQKTSFLSGTGYTEDKVNVSSIKGGLIIDTKDEYPFPKNGSFLNTFHEISTSKLGTGVPFTKNFIDYELYFSYKKKYTIHPRILFGFGDNTVPYTEQFRLGGQNSFFGLRENEYRGRQLLIGSLEYRWMLPFKIFFDTYFSVRADLGSIWEKTESIRFKDLRYGVGSTIALDTPIGPAQFSVGDSFLFIRNLPSNPISFGPVFFYFTIGYDLDY
jgi:NTE family protein